MQKGKSPNSIGNTALMMWLDRSTYANQSIVFHCSHWLRLERWEGGEIMNCSSLDFVNGFMFSQMSQNLSDDTFEICWVYCIAIMP